MRKPLILGILFFLTTQFSFGQIFTKDDLIGGSWQPVNTGQKYKSELRFLSNGFLMANSGRTKDTLRIFYSIEVLNDMSILQIGTIPYMVKKIDNNTLKQQGLYTKDAPRQWDFKESDLNTTIFKRTPIQ